MEHRKQRTTKPYSPEFRERAVRLAMEHRDFREIGLFAGSLRVWVRQGPRDGSEHPGATAADRDLCSHLSQSPRPNVLASTERF